MAKKEDKNNDKKEKKEPEVKKSFFKDERVKLIFGVFLLLFSLYLFITLLSFIFTWHQDQSFEWQNVFSSSGIRVSNWGGKLGAFFADLFMSSWFGLPALAIPVIPILWGLRLLHYKPVPFWRTIFKVILGIVLFSIVLAFLFGTANGFVGSGPGGAHGHFIAQWLTALIGKLGTAFLLLLALIAYGIY
ncbi:MAG TPA: DNA translocase FtsK 4TM domain-containing protein, partial [Tenuifilaceae bacterium]|nr:DNA translocase FtsK 4TM domain-containing protein [Tenuifilaceae bacterium]